MEKNYKYTSVDLEYIIKKFKKIRDDETLSILLVILKNVEVILPIEIDNIVSFSENNYLNNLKNNIGIYRLIVETTDGKTWSVCFSSEEQITDEIKERYMLTSINFLEIVKDCFFNENIDGITINPLNELHIHIEKDILKIILDE